MQSCKKAINLQSLDIELRYKIRSCCLYLRNRCSSFQASAKQSLYAKTRRLIYFPHDGSGRREMGIYSNAFSSRGQAEMVGRASFCYWTRAEHGRERCVWLWITGLLDQRKGESMTQHNYGRKPWYQKAK